MNSAAVSQRLDRIGGWCLLFWDLRTFYLLLLSLFTLDMIKQDQKQASQEYGSEHEGDTVADHDQVAPLLITSFFPYIDTNNATRSASVGLLTIGQG